MGLRQQPARGAAGPRPPAQAAGAGPSGQPVGHGRSPLAVDMRLRTEMGCRRVRLRTVGTPARGRGTFKCGRNERRRRRLRRAGGFRGGPGRRGRRRLRRAARVARRPGLQRAAASPARCSRHAGALSACWRESRSGAALAGRLSQIARWRRVCATVGIASSARGNQCQKGSRLVVSQAIWGWLV